MRKKIALLLINLKLGGTERQVIYLIESLLDQYEFEVYLLSEGGPFEEKLQELGVPFHVLGLKEPFWSFKNMKVVWRLHRSLLKKNISLIHSFLFYPNFLGAVLKLFSRRRFLIVSKRGSNYWYSKKHFILNRFVYRLADRIIPNSQAVAEEIKKYYDFEKKGYVIPNAVRVPERTEQVPEKIRMIRKEGNVIVGSIARFTAEKGYEDLFDIAPPLLQKYSDLYFVWIGGRGNFEEIKHKIESNGLQERILLTGEVTNVYEYLYQFDIFVFSSWSESMPNALMEAMACGLPVVARGAGGVKELLPSEKGIGVVSIEDMQGFRSLLEKFINDKALRLVQGKENQQQMERFSIEEMSKAYQKLYAEAK